MPDSSDPDPALLTLRPATAGDRTALLELQHRASLANEEDRDWLLANPGVIDIPVAQLTAATAVVALLGERLAGFAIVLPRDDGDAELDGLFVEPDLFRSGIGRALVAAAYRLARDMGARELHVIANEAALEFYRAVGFVQAGYRPTQLRPAPAMRKRLA